MNIFELFGTIAINNDAANRAISHTGTMAKGLGSRMNSVFSAIGKGAAVCGKAIGAGLAAGTSAMAVLVGKGMGLLGELEQNMGGSEAVFAEYADRMQKTAAEAYKNMGLSQADYLATANKMGSLFKGAGFETAEAANMTMAAMQRAADVASIMGIDVSMAMESIAGAAKGNFTMMDNLGVAINDTNLAQYALSKGIQKSTQEMTTQEKVALAMEMFMEKTAYAAGNYAKENDTLAGSLTTAKAAWKNFLSGVGTADELADSLSNAGGIIVKNLNALLPKLTTGIGKLISKLSPELPGLLQSALPGIIEGGTSLLEGLFEALPDLIESLAEILPGLFEKLWGSIKKTTPKLLETFKSLFDKIDFRGLGTAIGNGLKYIITNLPQIMADIGNAIKYAWENYAWPLIQGLFSALFGVELPDWNTLVSDISTGWNDTVWPAIQDFFLQNFGITVPNWEDTKTAISDWWGKVWDSVKNYFGAIFTIFTEDEDGLTVAERLKKWWFKCADALVGVISAVFGINLPKVSDIAQKITDWWETVWADIQGFFLQKFDITVPNWEDTKKAISGWWDKVWASVKNYFSAIFTIFTEDEDGLSVAERLKNWWYKCADALVGVISAVFGIKLPSIHDVVTSIKDWWNQVIRDVADFLNLSVLFPDLFPDDSQGSSTHGAHGGGGGGAFTFPSRFNGGGGSGTSFGATVDIPGHATGLDYVPYDNYIARLHKGETVLNAEAASAWRNGQGGMSDRKLDQVIDLLSAILQSNSRDVVLDSGALVGSLGGRMDAELGRISARKWRGN